MTLKSIIGGSLAIVFLLMFLTGIALIFHDFIGIVTDEGAANASILGLGSMSGNSHLVLIFLGIGLDFLSVMGMVKFYNRLPSMATNTIDRTGIRRMGNSITKTGMKIAQAMKKNKDNV